MIGTARVCARSVTVKATPAKIAAKMWMPENVVFGVNAFSAPNQLVAIERPTPTPNTSPSRPTSALAVFETPD
jgi:hypothetical protein